MLHEEVIDKSTLELLKGIFQLHQIDDHEFILGGGTCFALLKGHRKSIDLDFFTRKTFEVEELLNTLQTDWTVELINTGANSLSLWAAGIKVDFIRHDYPTLFEVKSYQGIKLFDPRDVAAMKVNAIINRGTRKDFVDLYFLLESYSLREILNYYLKKYPNASEILALKSLVFFDDAEKEPQPMMLIDIRWESIKEKIVSYCRREF